jgi:hypothetical protein
MRHGAGFHGRPDLFEAYALLSWLDAEVARHEGRHDLQSTMRPATCAPSRLRHTNGATMIVAEAISAIRTDGW